MHWGGIIARQRGGVKDFFRIAHLTLACPARSCLPSYNPHVQTPAIRFAGLSRCRSETCRAWATTLVRVGISFAALGVGMGMGTRGEEHKTCQRSEWY